MTLLVFVTFVYTFSFVLDFNFYLQCMTRTAGSICDTKVPWFYSDEYFWFCFLSE